MNSKIKTMVLGSLVAGSLIMSAAPAMARDWHFDRDHHWDNREWNDQEFGRLRGSRSDYEALEQARQKALYDASHHASRKKIAQDDAVIDEIANRIGGRR